MDVDAIRKQTIESHLAFTKVFFEVKTGRPFLTPSPIGRQSHYEIISKELEDCFRLKTKKLLINVPPGHGKSSLLVYFIAWTIAQYPDSNFLYISYSQHLAEKHTATIKEIIEMPLYKHLYGVELRKDSQAKGNFKTVQGGSVMAFGSSSSITGQDAGLPNLNRFSGAVVCFPYDAMVQTEDGPIKIGDIVTKELKVRIYSFNMKTKEIELRPINAYFENGKSDLVEIEFSDGEKLQCTPDHKIWKNNRGWIEARHLDYLDSIICISPSPNGSLRNTYQHGCFSLANREIFKNFIMRFTKRIEFIFYYSFWLFFSSFFCYVSPAISSSYSMYIKWMNPIISSNFFIRKRTQNNIDGILVGKLGKRALLSDSKSSVLLCVGNILSSTSVAKIFNLIIKPISIKMSSVHLFWFSSNKGKHYKNMNRPSFVNPVFRQSHIVMSFSCIKTRLFDFLRINSMRPMVSIINNSLFGSNSSKIRGAINPFISRNCSPLFIRKIGHADKTYCLEVGCNHNFFCGRIKEKSYLVSNCDDMHKPDEVFSDLLREGVIENYNQTIKPRPRGPNVPIIFIGQRLHEDDLAQYLIDSRDGYDWRKVILKGIDDAGNALCPNINSLEMLRIEQDTNPYVFASQYQQNPQPAGGGIFKPEWFPILDDEPKILETFLTVDTAESSKEWADATAFSFWGIYKLHHKGIDTDQYAIHWLKALELRIEPKDLEAEFYAFYADCMRYSVKPKAVVIEKKSTGVTLASTLKSVQGLRTIEVERTRASGSKTARYFEMQRYVASKCVSLPENGKHTKMVIEHMRKITANDSHKNDDLCDSCYDAVKLALIDRILVAPIKTDYTEVGKSLYQDSTNINRLRKIAYTR